MSAPTSPSAPLFRVTDLTKRYDDRIVLDRLSFDVLPGECLVILGRSGSGKSVTLRHLNVLEHPDVGSVVFDGLEISALREQDLYPIRRRVAMLFQGGALFDSMNVFDNIAFPLREHTELRSSEITEKVHDRLRRVGLREIDEKMPADLSGGMRKRVALARSLALDPEVVLYDEPTTGLDPMTGATIARLIRSTQDDLGVTSVVVTHDLPLARAVADRVAFIDRGSFRFVGTWTDADRTTDDLFSRFLAGEPDEGSDDG